MSQSESLQVVFLGSGSRGNATLVGWKGDWILLDCGFSPPELQRRLDQVDVGLDALSAVLLTHEHADHTVGLPLMARPDLPLLATERTAHATRLTRRNPGQWTQIEAGRPQRIGPFEVLPCSTPHDARDPVCFAIALPDGRRIGLATDLGYPSAPVIEALRGCDVLAIESNHDPELLRWGPYPRKLKRRIRSGQGHLSNRDAARLIGEIATDRLGHLFLIHLSETNNRPELALAEARGALGRLGLASTPVTAIGQDAPLVGYPPRGQLTLF